MLFKDYIKEKKTFISFQDYLNQVIQNHDISIERSNANTKNIQLTISAVNAINLDKKKIIELINEKISSDASKDEQLKVPNIFKVIIKNIVEKKEEKITNNQKNFSVYLNAKETQNLIYTELNKNYSGDSIRIKKYTADVKKLNIVLSVVNKNNFIIKDLKNKVIETITNNLKKNLNIKVPDGYIFGVSLEEGEFYKDLVKSKEIIQTYVDIFLNKKIDQNLLDDNGSREIGQVDNSKDSQNLSSQIRGYVSVTIKLIDKKSSVILIEILLQEKQKKSPGFESFISNALADLKRDIMANHCSDNVEIKFKCTNIKFPRVTVINGIASGDVYAVAASLIVSKTNRVMITSLDVEGLKSNYFTKNNKDEKNDSGNLPAFISNQIVNDSSDFIESFLKSSVSINEHWRITKIPIISQQSKQIRKLAENKAPGTSKSLDNNLHYLKNCWRYKHFSEIKKQWQITLDPDSLNQSYDKAIQEWLAGKGLLPTVLGTPSQPKNLKIIVLWSRLSGKKGRLHPEHDTSYYGIKQLIKKIQEKKHADIVIITGDKPLSQGVDKNKKGGSENSYANIIREFSENDLLIADVTEFWKDKKATEIWCKELVHQFRLYDYLARTGYVKHLFMRSGMMHAMSLLGYSSYYMEEPNSIGSERAEQWIKKSIFPLRRILISKPPTRTGKYIVDARRQYLEEKKKNEIDRLDSMVKVYATGLQKLSCESDIQSIKNEKKIDINIDNKNLEQEIAVLENKIKTLQNNSKLVKGAYPAKLTTIKYTAAAKEHGFRPTDKDFDKEPKEILQYKSGFENNDLILIDSFLPFEIDLHPLARHYVGHNITQEKTLVEVLGILEKHIASIGDLLENSTIDSWVETLATLQSLQKMAKEFITTRESLVLMQSDTKVTSEQVNQLLKSNEIESIFVKTLIGQTLTLLYGLSWSSMREISEDDFKQITKFFWNLTNSFIR